MKLTALPLVAALAGLAAAATTGSVYTYDPSTTASTTQRRTLSPNTARLVLAQRAGTEEYHISGALSEKEIDAINTYGSKTPLFGQDERIRKAFILLQGDTQESNVLSKIASSFSVSPFPSTGTKGLFNDLYMQIDPKASSSYTENSVTTKTGDYFYTTETLADLEKKFLQLREEGTWTITAIIVPYLTEDLHSADLSQWGTYIMPWSQTWSQQREKRQVGSEEPLSAPTTHSTVPISSSNNDANVFANNSTPLAGILPSCFRSQSECETSTRNCTGHGSCSLKYTNKDHARGAKGECYSCSCGATVVKSEDGKKKTTVWGGPACQKKDVSVQFWLIALFTVGLIFLVSFAVGTVYSMGSEELPSVIGAGVSGPVRK